MSVMFRPVHRKTLVKSAYAVSSMLPTSASFADPAADVPIVKDEFGEEDTP